MGPDLLTLLIIVAVLAGATESGRAFIREAWKATGWRTPRAAVQHHSGRAGAAAGRSLASAARASAHAAARSGRIAARPAIAGIGRRRGTPLIPLMWRGTSDSPAAGAEGAPPSAGEPSPPPNPAPVPAGPRLRVCAACGNPENGPRTGGGNWGPLVAYREPLFRGEAPHPRLIHKAHFEDESTGFYGRPHEPAPPSGNPGTGTAPVPSAPTGAPPGVPPRRVNMTARYTLNLEPPTTDGEFLESANDIGGVLKSLSEDIANWADGLSALNLPQSVLNPLHQVADGISDAATAATQAAKVFEDEFEDAREVASRGMHFTGQDAA